MGGLYPADEGEVTGVAQTREDGILGRAKGAPGSSSGGGGAWATDGEGVRTRAGPLLTAALDSASASLPIRGWKPCGRCAVFRVRKEFG